MLKAWYVEGTILGAVNPYRAKVDYSYILSSHFIDSYPTPNTAFSVAANGMAIMRTFQNGVVQHCLALNTLFYIYPKL